MREQINQRLMQMYDVPFRVRWLVEKEEEERRRRINNEKNKIFEGGEGANQVRVVLPERISLYAKLLWNDGLGGERERGEEAGLGIGPSADKIGGGGYSTAIWLGGLYRVQELYAGTFPDTCESIGDETAVNSRLGEGEKGRKGEREEVREK